MVSSEMFTSLLLINLSIIALFKVFNHTTFFTNAAVFCLLGGVISELVVGVLGICFEVTKKCRKKKEEPEADAPKPKNKLKSNAKLS